MRDDKTMNPDDYWWTLQVFLDPKTMSVVEVQYNTLTDTLRCSCSSESTCDHMRLVHARLKANQGTYPMRYLRDPTTEETEAAVKSPSAYRRFVIEHNQVEVI